ncbi:hypothetical protein RU639_007603 [Aspergillus parasiticus]
MTCHQRNTNQISLVLSLICSLIHYPVDSSPLLVITESIFHPIMFTSTFQTMSLDLVGIIFLADLSLIAQRTALTGGSTFLDTFILCPGLHRQQDAANVHGGEYPAVAAMTTGYVFRVENPATVNFLQRVGRTGQLTTLSITNIRKTKKGWLSPFMSSIDSSMSLGAVAAYLLAVSSTITVSYLLVLTEDWWGLLVLAVLMFTRFINVLLIRSRSRVGWSGASEPGVVGDLLVLLSQDRWVRIRGYVDDLKAVTSGEWLRDMTWVESAVSGFTTILVYLDVALASNAKLSGQALLLLHLIGTAGLLGLVNMLTQGLQMHGNLITVDIPRRKYRRRLDLAEALICETGRDDWAVRLGMINPSQASATKGNSAGNDAFNETLTM